MMATNTATQNIIQIESSTIDKLVQNITSGLHLKCILRIIFLFSLEPNNNSTLSTYHLNNDPIIRSHYVLFSFKAVSHGTIRGGRKSWD